MDRKIELALRNFAESCHFVAKEFVINELMMTKEC